MLNQPTLEKLHALRLHGMAEGFRAQSEQSGITELSFEERFALLVDQQWTWLLRKSGPLDGGVQGWRGSGPAPLSHPGNGLKSPKMPG